MLRRTIDVRGAPYCADFAHAILPLESRIMSRLSRWWRTRREPLNILKRGLGAKLRLTDAIHVGAHWAEEREDYETLGFARVLWIEASKETYRRLVERLADSTSGATQHIAVNALASDRAGEELTLRHFSNKGASNSIFPATRLINELSNAVFDTGESEIVISDTLDRVAEAHGFTSADLIVVDVQGAELLVLNGATKLLVTAKAVIVEVSKKPYFEGGVLQPELRQFLRSKGFKEIQRSPTHGDQLYVRRQ